MAADLDIKETMRLARTILEQSKALGQTTREAGMQMAVERVITAMKANGIWNNKAKLCWRVTFQSSLVREPQNTSPYYMIGILRIIGFQINKRT